MSHAGGFTFKRPGHHSEHHAKMGHAEVVLMLQIHKLALICRSRKLLSGRHCQTLSYYLLLCAFRTACVLVRTLDQQQAL